MSDTQQPVALITGGSRGIGLATAQVLAGNGYSLLLASRSQSALTETKQQLQESSPEANINTMNVDVAEESQVKALFQHLQSTYKRLDVLVNCAGIMNEAPLAMTRAEDLQQTFAVNVFGSYYCCQYAARLMARNHHGVIINLASVAGEQGAAGQSAYAASKAAIAGLTRSLARELAPQGIRVNAVAPGFIETDLIAGYNNERKARVLQNILLGRAGEAREVAELIAFLASDKASYITGDVIGINGGMRV